MTTPIPPRPTRGPSEDEVANSRTWAAVVSQSTTTVRDSAEKWRNGLAALVTLITGGLIVAGPSGTDIAATWRVVATLLTVGGVAFAAAGCFLALSISAGRPSISDLPTVVEKYDTVEHYLVIDAARKARALRWVSRLAQVAVAALVLGAGAWSMAPKAPAEIPHLQVDVGSSTYCGTLISADHHVVVVLVSGEMNPRKFPMSKVANLQVKSSC